MLMQENWLLSRHGGNGVVVMVAILEQRLKRSNRESDSCGSVDRYNMLYKI